MVNTDALAAPHDIFPGQYKWDPLEHEDSEGVTAQQATKMALAARDKMARMIRKHRPDLTARSWTLTGQLRKYKSFGEPDGRIRNVYYLNISMNN